ncbi:hypothetical protein OKW96_00200 [Sphingobacterium sp. KU25419]|nr:hypothetical protein OKW96_00200 [Sphingobacterium sp. KU25419]
MEYNPLTFSGGNAPLASKYYLPGTTFDFTANVATATGESTGKFTAMTDGNPATYWHTCYSGCSVPTNLPVEIVINMKEVMLLRVFIFKIDKEIHINPK